MNLELCRPSGLDYSLTMLTLTVRWGYCIGVLRALVTDRVRKLTILLLPGCEDDHLLRCALHRRLTKRQGARSDLAPVVQLILPVRAVGNPGFPEWNSVLRFVPIARVGDQTHRDRRANIYAAA
jgi:hypothetical protein